MGSIITMTGAGFPPGWVAPGGGGGAIALVQQNGVSFTNVTANQTFDLTGVTAGNLIVIVGSLYESISGGGAFSTPTSSNGTVAVGITPSPIVLFGTDSCGVGLWYIENATAGTHTIGYDPGTTTGSYGRVMALEFSNIAADANDVSTSGTDSTGSATSLNTGTTASLTQANNLIVSVLGLETDDASINTPATYTLAYDSNNTMPVGLGVVWKEVAATTAVSAAWTWGAGQEAQAVIMAFKKV